MLLYSLGWEPQVRTLLNLAFALPVPLQVGPYQHTQNCRSLLCCTGSYPTLWVRLGSPLLMITPSGSTLWLYKQHGNIHLCRMASTPSCPLLWELTSMDSISRDACTLWLPAGELWQISRRRREPRSLFPCPPFCEITTTWLSPWMKGPFKVPTPQNSLPFWVL